MAFQEQKCEGCKMPAPRLWKHARIAAAGYPKGLCTSCYTIEKETWPHLEEPKKEELTTVDSDSTLPPMVTAATVSETPRRRGPGRKTSQNVAEAPKAKRKYTRRATQPAPELTRRPTASERKKPDADEKILTRMREMRENCVAAVARATADLAKAEMGLDVMDQLFAELGVTP